MIIALPMKAHQRLANLVAELWNHPVRVKLVPDFSALVFTRATFESLGEVPLIGLRKPAIDYTKEDLYYSIRQSVYLLPLIRLVRAGGGC